MIVYAGTKQEFSDDVVSNEIVDVLDPPQIQYVKDTSTPVALPVLPVVIPEPIIELPLELEEEYDYEYEEEEEDEDEDRRESERDDDEEEDDD